MGIKIYFDVPQSEPAGQLQIFINGKQSRELKSVLFLGKMMLAYSPGSRDSSVRFSFVTSDASILLMIYLVNEETGETVRRGLTVSSFGKPSEINFSLRPILGAKLNVKRIKKGDKDWRLRSGGDEIHFVTAPAKSMRGDRGRFDHYLRQVEPEKLLVQKKKIKGYVPIDIYYVTDRKRKPVKKGAIVDYSNKRGIVEFGVCEVNIPNRKKKGEIPRPNWFVLEFRENKEKHMMVNSTVVLDPESFYGKVKEKVQSSPTKDAFLFVHGYNVDFKESILRAAQIAKDIGFKGAPMVYSWPSKARALAYTVDEATSTGYSLGSMVQVLKEIRENTGAERIHLIAHSMGNRFLASALEKLVDQGYMKDFSFNQVILAAPDIDAQVFVKEIAPKITECSHKVTLYASKKDLPLFFSNLLHGDRVGQAMGKLAIVEGMDTIDASAVDTDRMGHGYFATTKPLIDDIFQMIHFDKSPGERNLRECILGEKVYWDFW